MKNRAVCLFLTIAMTMSLLVGVVPVKAAAPVIQVKSVSAGGIHTAAVKSDGSLWTWGYNENSQNTDRTTPIKVMDNVAAVSAGGHTAVIKTDGSLWTWGVNTTVEELGGGTNYVINPPVKMLDNATAVSAGGSHTAAIKTDGSLWTWGSNRNGRLGDGTNTDRDTPVKVMDNVAAVSAGDWHTAAIKTDGTLWTWGKNGNGELGDGTLADKNTPVKVMDNVAAVSAGCFYTVVIKTDGSLWTWGMKDGEARGDGQYTTWNKPSKVMDNVMAVSAGRGTTAAIKTDGSLWTWGENYGGQLGDGTNTNKSTPVKVMDNVAAVSVGGSHTAAIKTDGSLWTWGKNESGELGDGTNTDRSTPVKVFDSASAAASPAVLSREVKVFVNGTQLDFDQPPVIKNGRTLVPIRAIAEALGSNVSWDEKTKTAIIQRGLETAVFQIGRNKAYAKKNIDLDVNAQVINGRTLIPLRAVSEIFDATVDWDADTYTVNITCEELTDEKILNEFYVFGFYKFNYFNNFISEHGDLNYALTKVLSEIGDFGKRIVARELKNVISAISTGDTSWTNIASSLDDYQKDVLKESIMTILENVKPTDNLEIGKIPTEVKNAVNGANTAEKALQLIFENKKTLTESQKKGLDGFEEATSTLKNTIKWSNLGIDVFNCFIADYFKQLQYLEIIDNAIKNDDEKMQAVVDELYLEFANKYAVAFDKIIDEALNEGASNATKFILSLAGKSAGSLYSVTTYAIEGVSSLTGAKDYANNVENATALMRINFNLTAYYDSLKNNLCSIDGILSADENSWGTLVSAFYVAKAGLTEAYSCMYSVTYDSAEKLYLESQIELLDSIKISQTVPASKSSMFSYVKREFQGGGRGF